MTQQPPNPPYGQPPEPGQPGQNPQQPGQPYQQQPYQQPYAAGGTGGGISDADAVQYSALAHLLGFLSFLPSLIIFLVYKDRSPMVREESRKALNFQITMVIAYVVLWILNSILYMMGLGWIGTLLMIAWWVVLLVFSIQGYQSIKRGNPYKYPFALDLIK